jgi:prepilin-type N-terminal cleavage/methylation domain-containing protein
MRGKHTGNERGVSLLEVLIALAIMGVVTAAVMQAYVTQHENYMVQEDITDIQQNARASVDELVRNVRMAGHDIPPTLLAIAPSNTNPDTITITYTSSSCETFLRSTMASMSEALKCSLDVACFNDLEWCYIYDPDSGGGEWFQVSKVDAANRQLDHISTPLSTLYGAGSVVKPINQIKYYIDTSNSDHPQLMMQRRGSSPQVYAEDISDLQFQYRMKNGTIIDEPVLVDNIREVLIAVRGRSHDVDIERDERRVREFVTSVSLRNLGN